MEKIEMYVQLNKADRDMGTAYTQIYLLHQKLEDMKYRYRKAVQTTNKLFRYHLRMKIVTLEGIISSYYEYALLKKEEVKDLRFKLFGEDPGDEYNDDSDEYEDSNGD